MNYFDQHAAGIQAIAALATFLLTGVLVFVTWRYVELTRNLVDQNRELTEIESGREVIRRRRKAISLRRVALVLQGHLQQARDLLPVDLHGADWDWRTEIDEVKRLALDVGWGSESHALEAGEHLEEWYAAGMRAQNADGPAHRATARKAMEGAIASIHQLVVHATRINEDEP